MDKKKIIIALLVALPMFLPLVVTNQYYIQGILCRIIIYGILVMSLDLIVGYIGDVSIGHAGFFALGAYTVGILTANPAFNSDSSMTHYPQLPFLIALLAGIGVSALAGFILGFPALRLNGPYLAVVTIAYGLLIYTIINEQEKLTNGTKGIALEPLQIAGVTFRGNSYLYVIYPMLVVVMYMLHNLTKSYWGRAFEAIKYSDVAAATCGISKSYYKVGAFVISAGIAGLAGGLFTHLDNYIAPNTFSYNFSVEFLIALIVGGVQSLFGNLLGVSVYVLLPDLFNKFSEYRLIIFGVALLLVLYFLPRGLVSLFDKYIQRFSKHDEHETMDAEQKEEMMKKRAELITPHSEISSSHLSHLSSLEIKNLTMRFGGLTAVNQLNIKIKTGSIHGLIGPNGSGKSTTVNLLTGIYAPAEGSINFLGSDVADKSTYQRAKLGISRTFQNLQLFGDLTALQNVMVGMHNSFKSNLMSVLLGLPAVKKEEQAVKEKSLAWLEFVGLGDAAYTKAKNLSYGQARFLEMARALAGNTKLLLLDEPAAGLTTGEIEKMNLLIKKIKNYGITVLLIEHHMDMVMSVSDEITVLDFGKKISEGAPKTIQNDPNVIAAYLGTHSTSFQ